MRKLASIQKILNIDSIANADSIEKATILGWHVVVKKDEFKFGDTVIYCEIDSVLPDKPEFEFLKPKNFRIKTVKLRGQVSQGICFPLNILENVLAQDKILDLQEGDDVTKILGVEKFEMPIPLNMKGKVKGDFPVFIPKTDETRIQSIPEILHKYKNLKCFITEKIDGSSMTVYLKDGEFGVCSRNLELLEDESNMFWKAVRSLDIENKLRKFTETNKLKNISLQGELVGSGVQGDKYVLKKLDFMIFNVFDIDKYKYLSFSEFIKFIEEVDLKAVPLVQKDFVINHSVDDLVTISKGNSKLNENVKREGIVIRPLEEIDNVDEIGRLSFKVINPDFLLKYDE